MTVLLNKIENHILFRFIKENLSLLILLPSLLGGLRQFIILLYYSPTLIQYFSFSQIAIDGLETIIQGLYVLILTILVYKCVKNKIVMMAILLCIILFIVVRFSWYVIVEVKEDSFFSYNLTTLKSYFYKILILTTLSFYIALSYALRKIDYMPYKRFVNISLFVTSIILSIVIILFIVIYKPFQYNVQNVIDVTKKIRKEKSSSADLVYYNDSYLIFVLNPNENISKRKYLVEKFEILFENDKELKNYKVNNNE